MTGGESEAWPVDTDDDAGPPGDSSRWLTIAAIAALVLGVALILVWAIGRATLDEDDGAASPLQPGGSATTAATTPAGLGVGQAAEVRGRRPLRGFGEVQATITDRDGEVCEVCLLAAVDEEQRARGLMEVTDLGGYDGMVFVYRQDVGGGFYMRNTPSPLSIAFFGADGRLVSSTDMAPCADVEGCPTYSSKAPYRYAVEVSKGSLPDIGVTGGGATIRLDGTPCPLAQDLQRSGR